MDINTVSITGRLTKNADKRFQRGKERAVLSFDVAVDRPSYKYATDFIPCRVFGPYGEAVYNYLSKGARVAITGEIQSNTWEDKNKVKHFDVYLSVQNLVLLDKIERKDDPPVKTKVDELTEELDEMFGEKELAEYIGDDDELPF